jgi:hypothetical protein
MSQGEILKLQEDGIKSGRTEQRYQFKKYRTQLARMSRKTPLYARPAGRNRSDQYAQALKK